MINTTAFIQNLNWTEITLILFVVVLLFGAKRLPELARGVGKSIKEFKKATSGIEEDIRSAMEEEEKPKPRPSATPIDTKPEPAESTASKQA